MQARGIAYRASEIKERCRTLLFVHGLSGSLSAWYPYEEHFEKDFNVITFDLRGHGLSVHPRQYSLYALEESVADIRELLQHLGVHSPTVISHSYGAPVAMEYLRAHGGEAAIFLAPPFSPHPLLRLLRPLLFAASIIAWLLPHPLGMRTDYTKYTPAGDWSVDRIFTDISNMGLRSYLWGLRQLYATNRDAHWHDLSMPVLIVHGTQDSIVPIGQARALTKQIPHATLREVAGANHILPLNNRAEVIRAVEGFVR